MMLKDYYTRIWIFTWIFSAFSFATKISRLQNESQTTDLHNMFAQCYISNGQVVKTHLNAAGPNNESLYPDPFLLTTCYNCFQLITSSKVNRTDHSLDYKNKSQVEEACRSHEADCIDSVVKCCEEASNCCIRQLRAASNFSVDLCPMSWDGLLCVKPASENVTQKMSCPNYISFFKKNEFASKRCTSNLTYSNATSETRDLLWTLTDYIDCLGTRVELRISQIKFYFLIISLCLLLASLLVFLAFKSLRSQLRIKIHINLFISLSFRCLVEIINTIFLIDLYTKLISGQEDTTKYLNNNTCNWIHVLLKYFQNSTFHWMLCEALLLYQLLFRSFERISSIFLYLFIGWCIPLIFTGTYYIIRAFHSSYSVKEKKCWVRELPKLEYLIRVPNILVLLVNIVFLINIIRLIRNLPTQPYDTSYWKRTLKAVTVLVPLFGLHLLLVAFPLEIDNFLYFSYTVIQNIVQDSQGIAVSLAFCAFNQEVFNILHDKVTYLRCKPNRRIPHSLSNRPESRKHGSLNSRSIHISTNSLPMIVRDSVEQKIKINKHELLIMDSKNPHIP